MGGFSEPQQLMITVEAAKETSKWWIPIAVALITGICVIIAAKRKRK